MARRLTVLLSALLLAWVATPGTAAADAPVQRFVERFQDDAYTLDCGGLVLSVVEGVFVRASAQPAPQDEAGQAFLAHEVLRFTTTATNQTTGRSFTGTVHVHFLEQRATLVEGTVYRFDQLETVSLLVRGDSGPPWFQGRFVLQHDQVFDTLGDGQPGGVELDRTTTLRSGELFDFPDLCEAGAALTT